MPVQCSIFAYKIKQRIAYSRSSSATRSLSRHAHIPFCMSYVLGHQTQCCLSCRLRNTLRPLFKRNFSLMRSGSILLFLMSSGRTCVTCRTNFMDKSHLNSESSYFSGLPYCSTSQLFIVDHGGALRFAWLR